MEATERAATALAHKFNNLVTVFLNSTNKLLASLPTDGPDRKATEEIRAASEQLAALAQRLFALTPQPPAPAESTGPDRATVLVADDNADVRSLVGRILRHQGCTVLEAANGSEALQLATAASGNIDLAVLDLVMPDLDGGQVAERLRQISPETRILFLSGYDGPTASGYVAMENVPFLQKPFTAEVLIRKVRDVLE